YAEGVIPESGPGDLGSRWQLRQIALRMWPAATALQEVITALFNLVRETDVKFADVARVRLSLSKTPFDMHGGFSTYAAKFEALLSAHYVTGVYLRDRTVTLDQFEPSCYDAPELRAFAAEKVEILHDPSLKNGQAIAEVTTVDGATLRARCDHPLGSPENAMTQAQVEEKFRTYAEGRLPASRAEEAIATVRDLERLGSTRKLLALLRAS
ncbi:MAG: hypothetical protein WD470_10980, partial [Rhodospirillaceae bacterium]